MYNLPSVICHIGLGYKDDIMERILTSLIVITQEMKAAGAVFRFVSYPEVVHGFTNPDVDAYAKKFNLPIAYNADADRKSWED